MSDIVDTEGEVVADEPVKPADIPVEDLPAYTIAGTVQWLRDPKNAATIEEFGKRLDVGTKRFAQRVEEEFAPVGQLMVNMAKDESVAQSVLDDFLRSLTGIED